MSVWVEREQEQALLAKFAVPSASVMTAIYGRRRIGKTSLVTETYKDHPRFFSFEGIENQNETFQRDFLASRLQALSPDATIKKETWTDLLICLSEIVGAEPAVIFFDEFQWLAANKTTLVAEFKYVWDNYFKKNNRVHIVLCGSSSSFILKKVINSKALYGRIENFIRLHEIDMQQVFNGYFATTSENQVLDYYLATGGVPKYLELFDRNKSSRQNIESLFFSPHGYFVDEYNRIFISHFGHRDYQKIVECLASHGLSSKPRIQKATKIASGGGFSEKLDDLLVSGFVSEHHSVHNPTSKYLQQFYISDPYLRFYFRHVQPYLAQIREKPWQRSQLIADSAYFAWRGLAFEQTCIRNHKLLAKRLGFSAVFYDYGSFFKRGDATSKGSQIDLLFKRKDQMLLACEIKYSASKLTNMDVVMDQRVEPLAHQFPGYGIQRILISATKPAMDAASMGAFDQIVTLDDLLHG